MFVPALVGPLHGGGAHVLLGWEGDLHLQRLGAGAAGVGISVGRLGGS